MPEMKKASCLICSLQCGFAMEVDAGVPVRMDFDGDSPLARGSLCARGHYNLELLQHDKRFMAATVKRRRAPWPAGVTKMGERLREVKEAHGGESIGVILSTELSNEDYETAAAFASSVIGTQSVGVAYDGSDFPLLMGGGTGDAVPTDIDDADCFILIGDVFWGHPCVAKRVIEARHKSRSNHVVTINPYRSNTDWFADLHLKPNADASPFVLGGILKAMNVQGAPPIDVDKAAEVAGVTSVDFEILAKRLRQYQKVVVLASSRLGNSTSWYLTGMYASKLASALKGKYMPLLRGGNAIGAFRRISSTRTVPEILADVEEKKIKALLVFGPDIVEMYPGVLTTEQLEGLEFLAASAIFENDTTRHADLGLPQAVWTEFDGSYTPSFGFSTEITAITDPQGDARSVGEMLRDFAADMGATISPSAAEAVHPELQVDPDRALGKLVYGESDKLSLVEGIHPLHRWDGAITGRMSFTQLQSPYCEAWIGEEAAAELGVTQGGTVVLASDLGETQLIVTVTDRMPGRLVAVPTYVADARGLMAWAPNKNTRWFDVTSSGVKVTPEG